MRVTILSQGGASMGDLYQRISDGQALGALECAHRHGINFFDTSPWYGVGLSEARFGLALHRVARRERESASAVIRRAVRFHLLADRAAERLLYGEE